MLLSTLLICSAALIRSDDERHIPYEAHFMQTQTMLVAVDAEPAEVSSSLSRLLPDIEVTTILERADPVEAYVPVPKLKTERNTSIQHIPRQRRHIRLSEEIAVLPAATEAKFPELGNAIYPVAKTPDWGDMRSSAEWNRSYDEMGPSDFVPVPAYDISRLTTPMYDLSRDLQEVNIPIVTEKLFYSTRFFGRYHADSGEFQGTHPGIDLKLAAGTPVGSVAGGRVHATGTDESLGNFVMILHRLPDGNEIVSIYGHLESVSVREGQDVAPGTIIGRAGSTGRSSGVHLHLQIDWKREPVRHTVYAPASRPSKEEASKWTIHPIEFIQRW